jgi:hypothetical protein
MRDRLGFGPGVNLQPQINNHTFLWAIFLESPFWGQKEGFTA